MQSLIYYGVVVVTWLCDVAMDGAWSLKVQMEKQKSPLLPVSTDIVTAYN